MKIEFVWFLFFFGGDQKQKSQILKLLLLCFGGGGGEKNWVNVIYIFGENAVPPPTYLTKLREKKTHFNKIFKI